MKTIKANIMPTTRPLFLISLVVALSLICALGFTSSIEAATLKCDNGRTQTIPDNTLSDQEKKEIMADPNCGGGPTGSAPGAAPVAPPSGNGAPAGFGNSLVGCNDKDPKTTCDILAGSCSQASGSVACQERDQSPGSNRIYGANGIITKVIRLASIVVGIAAIVMLTIGGFKYIIASGDPANLKSAKNTILYALVGLGAALIAQAIVVFVINRLVK